MIDAEWTADLEMSLRIYEMQVANQLLHIRIDQARDIVRQALAVLRGRVQTLPVVLQMTPAALPSQKKVEKWQEMQQMNYYKKLKNQKVMSFIHNSQT